MKKKAIALILALSLCLGLAACGSAKPAAPKHTAEPVHKIGVIVYNTGDEEVIGFREYLQGYIEANFPMVRFLYSDSIQTEEEELAFIQSACDRGVEGFMSFLSRDLQAEVALCEQNHAYYLLASGTVSDEDFDAVADNPWFLGMFGPASPSSSRPARTWPATSCGKRRGTATSSSPAARALATKCTISAPWASWIPWLPPTG